MPLGISPQGYLFGLIGKKNIEQLVDFNKLYSLPVDKIPFTFITMLQQAVTTKENTTDTVKIQRLEKSLRDNKDALKRFNEKLVELMSDRGQQIINLYLDGDEAEIERRRYYNSLSSGYDIYPKMFAVALKLVSPQNQLHHILQVKYHYFSGVTARIKIPLVENPARLIDTALLEQTAALKLEENAAYINNELGIIYKLKKDYVTAEKYFLRATQITPSWALPWSNLGGLYNHLNNFEKGIEALEKAKQLQPGYQSIYTNTGILNEKKGNFLLAEEFFKKSIRINTRHYLPFERLGYVYMNTTRYAKADSNFHEADIRKRGFKFLENDSDADGVTDQFDVAPPAPPCPFDTTTVRKNDIIGNFYIALLYIYDRKPDKAEWKLKQLIQLDAVNPLAFHYLGELLYNQQRWKEADIIFSYAVKYHMDKERFDLYCDSLKKLFPQYDDDPKNGGSWGIYSCVSQSFNSSWFQKMETRFFLGTVYEKWNHFEEAEKQFRAIIKEDSLQIGGYYKLWTLLENTGRYHDAEEAVRSYPNKKLVQLELFGLYRRIIHRHPESGEWYYKAGSLMYDMAAAEPDEYRDDIKYIKNDSDEEMYYGDNYEEQTSKEYQVPATGEIYYLDEDINFPRTEGISYLKKAGQLIPENSFVKLDENTTTEINNGDLLAEINYKTGDLYVWQGLPQRAEPYYKKSVELKPNDAGTRIKYVNSNIVNYNYALALEQLDTLYNRGEINFTSQLLMSEYCIHSGRFADGDKLLKEAKNIHPYKIQEITDLNGRLHLLSGKPLLAIPYYKEYLNDHPDDVETMYTIAKLYAGTKNSTEAWKWLTMSLKKGFNYYWVLKFDESWNSFRPTTKWNELTGHIKPVN
jgi:Tfp pilus assembly protein PilF